MAYDNRIHIVRILTQKKQSYSLSYSHGNRIQLDIDRQHRILNKEFNSVTEMF